VLQDIELHRVPPPCLLSKLLFWTAEQPCQKPGPAAPVRHRQHCFGSRYSCRGARCNACRQVDRQISSEYTATERRFIPSNGPAALKTRKNKRFGVALAAGDCQSRSFKPTAGCGSAAPEPTWIALRFDICHLEGTTDGITHDQQNLARMDQPAQCQRLRKAASQRIFKESSTAKIPGYAASICSRATYLRESNS